MCRRSPREPPHRLHPLHAHHPPCFVVVAVAVVVMMIMMMIIVTMTMVAIMMTTNMNMLVIMIMIRRKLLIFHSILPSTQATRSIRARTGQQVAAPCCFTLTAPCPRPTLPAGREHGAPGCSSPAHRQPAPYAQGPCQCCCCWRHHSCFRCWYVIILVFDAGM